LAALLILATTPARADITASNMANGHVSVVPNPVGEVLSPLGVSPPAILYKYCWGPPAAIPDLCVAHQVTSSSTSEVLSGFTTGTPYQLNAYCWCRVHIQNYFYSDWKPIGTQQFTYAIPPDAVVSTRRVRIRSVSTNQCLYVETGSSLPKHWVCWADPNMVFEQTIYGDGSSTFRHLVSGRCLWGFLRNSPSTSTWGCGALGTHFTLIPAGNPQVRLFVPETGLPLLGEGYGGCYYADGGNGGSVLKEFCVGNERSLFVLEPA
jgi:hypothetical protein